MTLVKLPQEIAFPASPQAAQGSATLGLISLVFNTAGWYFGLSFQSPVTDTITKIGFRTAAINAGDIDCRVETIDATGFPSGTLWGTSTNYFLTLAGTEDNAFIEVTLTNPASVNAGDIVGIKFVLDDASMGNFSSNISIGASSGLPAVLINQGTPTWRNNNTGGPIASVCFGSAGYIPLNNLYPVSDVTTHTFNSNSTPDVYANKITTPYKCRVSGAWVWGDFDGNVNINLYAADGVTVLATFLNNSVTPPSTGQGMNFISFPTPVDLAAGDVVYLGYEPTTTTNVAIYSMVFNNTDLKKIYVGSEAVYSTSKNPSGVGSWTDTTTRILMCGLMISHIDNGVGGGGGGSESYFSFVGS